MELSQMLSGLGTFSGAASGFTGGSTSTTLGNLSQGLNNASAASSGGGGSLLGALGSGAATGAALGSVIPGIGTAIGGGIGAAIGAIGSLLGGGGIPDHERGDLITIARDNDISQDEASWVCGYEESKVKDNYDTICARAARDRGYFQSLLAKYNAAFPGKAIQSKAVQVGAQYSALQAQAATMFASAPAANPFRNLSLQGAQQAASSQSMSLEDYLKALLNGAISGLQTGVAGAAADTPAGEAATWDVIKTQAKKYELLLVAFGLGIAGLAYKAFNK